MHVRSMNEIEDCPTITLKITYPDDYPNEVLTIGKSNFYFKIPPLGGLKLFPYRLCITPCIGHKKDYESKKESMILG